MIQQPGKFIFGTGVGSGYSGVANIIGGIGFNLGLYLLRDRAPSINKLMDEQFKEGMYDLIDKAGASMPFVSPIYILGKSGYEVYEKEFINKLGGVVILI